MPELTAHAARASQAAIARRGFWTTWSRTSKAPLRIPSWEMRAHPQLATSSHNRAYPHRRLGCSCTGAGPMDLHFPFASSFSAQPRPSGSSQPLCRRPRTGVDICRHVLGVKARSGRRYQRRHWKIPRLTTTWASLSAKWGCWTKRSANCRKSARRSNTATVPASHADLHLAGAVLPR